MFMTFDRKARLASGIALTERGWEASTVSRLLVLPDQRTARRRVTQHAATFETAGVRSGAAGSNSTPVYVPPQRLAHSALIWSEAACPAGVAEYIIASVWAPCPRMKTANEG